LAAGKGFAAAKYFYERNPLVLRRRLSGIAA
jgi:hypothetical protein